SFIAEAQGSLRSAEQALDSFFRDPVQRAELPNTVRQLHQVAGALQLLDHGDAAAAAASVGERVQGFIAAEAVPSDDECELVASSLGALGFFIDSLQQPGRSTTRFAFAAATGRFSAALAEPRREAPSVVVSLDAVAPRAPRAPAPDTAEFVLAGHSQRAGELIGSLRQAPDDAALRSELRETLEQLRDDAQLVDDGALKTRASEAIALLDAGANADRASLQATLDGIAGTRAQADQPAQPEPERDEAEIDSELLEIFLGEAQEVLAAIAEAMAQSRRAPADQTFLTTIRRGFHTLKGSSRMVGLTEFGEAGWSMEQVLNLWLAEERAGTPALYALIGIACQRFERWVGLLQQGAAFRLDPSPMIAAATALREAQPHEAAFEALAAQSEEAAIAQAAGPAIEAVVAAGPVEVAEAEPVALEVVAPEVVAPMVVDESITVTAPWIETWAEVTVGNAEEIAETADAAHAT